MKSSIISYPDTLLTIADNLINQGYFNIAVVTAIMACEVAIERAFDSVYKAKGMVDIGEAINGLMNGNSLANDKHRKLFNSLTNIKLEKQRFWQNYKEACQKRNSIIHKGGHAIKSEADLALEAAHEMVNFLFKLEWTE